MKEKPRQVVSGKKTVPLSIAGSLPRWRQGGNQSRKFESRVVGPTKGRLRPPDPDTANPRVVGVAPDPDTTTSPPQAGDGLTAVRYTFWRNIDLSVGKRGRGGLPERFAGKEGVEGLILKPLGGPFTLTLSPGG